MRSVLLLLVAGLAGCAADTTPGPAEESRRAAVPASLQSGDSVRLVELYDGVVVAAHAEVLAISPDQLGDVERSFYVHEGTHNITFELDASDDLSMEILEPGCHDLECASTTQTQGGQLVHVIEQPAIGNWEVVFFKRDAGATEISYELHLTKDQEYLFATEIEAYDGSVVAAHLGAIRISPDQLGDVYREFWVHEGVRNMTIDVTVSQDIYFVLGQSDRGRDNDSEEGWVTQDGALSLQMDDPQAGGWYMIFFHHPDGPGVAEVDYTVHVSKQRPSQG